MSVPTRKPQEEEPEEALVLSHEEAGCECCERAQELIGRAVCQVSSSRSPDLMIELLNLAQDELVNAIYSSKRWKLSLEGNSQHSGEKNGKQD